MQQENNLLPRMLYLDTLHAQLLPSTWQHAMLRRHFHGNQQPAL